jgi:hypothetical protein
MMKMSGALFGDGKRNSDVTCRREANKWLVNRSWHCEMIRKARMTGQLCASSQNIMRYDYYGVAFSVGRFEFSFGGYSSGCG